MLFKNLVDIMYPRGGGLTPPGGGVGGGVANFVSLNKHFTLFFYVGGIFLVVAILCFCSICLILSEFWEVRVESFFSVFRFSIFLRFYWGDFDRISQQKFRPHKKGAPCGGTFHFPLQKCYFFSNFLVISQKCLIFWISQQKLFAVLQKGIDGF